MDNFDLEKIRAEIVNNLEVITNEKDELLGEAMTDKQANILSQSWLDHDRNLWSLNKGVRDLIAENADFELAKTYKDVLGTISKFCEGKLSAYCLARPLGKYACGLFVPSPIVSVLVSNLKIRNEDNTIIYRSPSSLWRVCLNNEDEKSPLRQALGKFMRDIRAKNGKSIPGYYQKIYRERLGKEIEKNNSGKYADSADKKLDSPSFSHALSPHFKQAYLRGKYPVVQLESRAAMHTAKIFLANYWETLYEFEEKKPAPQSYFADGDTKVYIERPIVEGIVGIAYLNVKNSMTKGVIVGKAPEGSLEPIPATE